MDPTTQASGSTAALNRPGEPGSPGRRLNIGGMPAAPTALLLTALAVVAGVVASSALTLQTARSVLRQALPQASLWFDLAALLLMLAALFIVWPLWRCLRHWREVQRAAAGQNIVAARVARSATREQGWIAIGYAVAQGLVVLAAQFLLVNEQAVAKTFFLAPLMLKTFPLVLKAFWLNVQIFLIAEVCVLAWGLVVALASFAPGPAGKPLRLLATAYIDVFRAIPAVLVIYLVGFGLPLTGLPLLKDLSLNSYVIAALTLTVGAYVAEIYRTGILSIHWSQTAAARSLGLSHMQTLRHVVLPQGVRHIVPALMNAFIALQKDTALLNVIGVIEAFNQSMLIASNYYNLSAVTTVAILFILISIPQTRFVARMMERDRARTRSGA